MITGDIQDNERKLLKIEEIAVKMSLLIGGVVSSNEIPAYMEANEDGLEVLFWLDREVDGTIQKLFDATNRAYMALSFMAEKNREAQRRATEFCQERKDA